MTVVSGVASVGRGGETNTAATGHTDCGCGWCASTDFLVCRVGEMARWSRRYLRNLSNARRFDLSDHLLDCRRSLPRCLFRVDVRRVVRGLVEAGLTAERIRTRNPATLLGHNNYMHLSFPLLKYRRCVLPPFLHLQRVIWWVSDCWCSLARLTQLDRGRK